MREEESEGSGWMEPSVYGFARHPSCNRHPPPHVPYFAADIAGYRYIFICEKAREYACVYVSLERARLFLRARFIVLSSVVSYG